MKLRSLSLGLVSATALLGFAVQAQAATVTVQPGDSFYRIATENHTTVSALEEANTSVNPLNLQPGTELQLPSLSGSSYDVQAGDSLWKIATKENTTVAALEAINPNLSVSNLQVGTTLQLPSSHVTVRHAAPTLSATPSVTPSATGNAAQQNLYWMEHVIHAEASGEPLSAQIAVGDVIMHRIAAGGYGSTVKDVVFQVIAGHYQFSSVPNSEIYKAPDATNDQAAIDVLENHQDSVPGALVFFNPAKTSSGSWVWSQPRVAKIGDFIFAK